MLYFNQTGMKATEKRSLSRIKLHTSLRYQIRGRAEFNNTVSDDISLKGLGIINDRFISPQTYVMLEISILSRILKPMGKIAWAQPLPHSDRYRLGIEFLELDPQEKNYLQGFIDMQRNIR